jgi:hypothetical protein
MTTAMKKKGLAALTSNGKRRGAQVDDHGRVAHAEKKHCPNCGAFNVAGLCGCTVRREPEGVVLAW